MRVLAVVVAIVALAALIGALWSTSQRGERARVPPKHESAEVWVAAVHADDALEGGTSAAATSGRSPVQGEVERSASTSIVDELVVECVDALDGRPVPNAPIALLVRDLRDGVLAVCETDASGVARFRGARELVERSPAVHAKLFAALQVVAMDAVEVEIDRRAWPNAPVRLAAPPFGAVQLRLLDWSGEAIDPRGSSAVSAVAVDGERDGPEVLTRAASSRVSYPCVATGTRVRVTLDWGTMPRLVAGEFVGPSRAGEVVESDYRLRVGETAITATILRSDGSPLVDHVVRGVCGSTHLWGRTNRTGRVRMSVDSALWDPAPTPGTQIDLELEAISNDAPSTARIRSYAAISMPVLHEGTDADIGTVEIQRTTSDRLLCSGTVSNAWGGDVYFTYVNVEPARPASAEESDRPHRTSTVVDTDGRFAVFGSVDAERVVVRATRDDGSNASSELVECAVGRTDVRLVIQGGGIAGRVLVDPEIDPRELDQFDVRFDRDGRFTWQPLSVGLHEFTLYATEGDAELVSVANIEVTAGEVKLDARLNPLDLRGKLAPWRLRFVDAQDRVVPSGNLILRDLRDAESDFADFEFGAAGVNLVLPHADYEAVVRTEELEWKRVSRSASEQTIRLLPRPRIELSLRDGCPEWKARYELGVLLVPEEWGAAWSGGASGAAFDAGGPLRMLAPRAGRIRVIVELGLHGDDDFEWTQPFEPELLEVLDGPELQPFTLRLDRAAIEAALRSRGG